MNQTRHIFEIRGKVKKGQSRGKKLGFPTANIALHKKIPEGVYISKTYLSAGKTIVEQKEHNSLTFIGRAKTFNENKYQAETYIFNFNETIYEKFIKIELIKKLRGNQKFDSPEKLIEQMEKDKKEALDYFNPTHP